MSMQEIITPLPPEPAMFINDVLTRVSDEETIEVPPLHINEAPFTKEEDVSIRIMINAQNWTKVGAYCSND